MVHRYDMRRRARQWRLGLAAAAFAVMIALAGGASAGPSSPSVSVDVPSTSYSNLKAAFDAINNGTLTGEVTINITGSTTEGAIAELKSSGTGSANYTKVLIQPTVDSATISGSLNSTLIWLNGADNVTIDGRKNSEGSTGVLTIDNSYVGTSARTFVLSNGATSNTLQYVAILGAGTRNASAYNGMIYFYTDAVTGSLGNDNNTIDHCNLRNSSTGTPAAAIYSAGTTSKENSGNTISNNVFSDWHDAAQTTHSYAIFLEQSTTGWTITGNSFYQTASRSTTNFSAINIGTGSGYTVSANCIGGQAANCGSSGSPLTLTNCQVFGGIRLVVGTSPASVVQGNTIRNVSVTSSTSLNHYGIGVREGAVNIGSSSAANVIDNLSFTLTGSGTFPIWGIAVWPATGILGDIKIAHNSIGGISVTGSSADAQVSGIYLEGAATTCQNNMVALGTDISTGYNIYGVKLAGTNTNKLYFNTVYIGGSVGSSSSNTYAIYRDIAGAEDYRNNLLYNARTSTGGSHVALRTSSTNGTSNYNLLYAPGTGGAVGMLGTTAYTSLAAWQSASGFDANSVSGDPRLEAPASNNLLIKPGTDYDPVPAGSHGSTPISGITVDYGGAARDASTPDIGADEFEVDRSPSTDGTFSAGNYDDVTVGAGITSIVGTGLASYGVVTNNGTLKQTRTVNANSTVDFLNVSTTKYYGVQIRSGGAALGSTTVAVAGNQACANIDSNSRPVLRCYTVTPSSSGTATVRFYYRFAELRAGQNPANLRVWQYAGSGTTWNEAGGSAYGRSASVLGTGSVSVAPGGPAGYERSACVTGDEGCYVEVSGLSLAAGDSRFLLMESNPTSAVLAAFAAEAGRSGVTVTWETVSELGNLGFNLYRAPAADGPWLRLNGAVIPSRAPGSPEGFAYTWLDREVRRGEYWYRLHGVGLDGSELALDTASVRYRYGRTWLPIIR